MDGARAALVAWYRGARRQMPWRGSRDPYAIWVSEIMLQQTRVDTVTPRFVRWMARFPTVRALADAPRDDVMEEWAGLGYYARARNLHDAAREVATRYDGVVPDDPDAISSLPGIGRYTAGAILSLAFGRRAPILDGNVIRVLARLRRVDGDPRSPAVNARLWTLAESMVADGPPEDVNQGMMELGAMVCTPRAPRCLVCPLRPWCVASAEGVADRYPAASKPTPVKKLSHVAVALFRRERLLLLRRPPSGLWGGLYELPSGEIDVNDADPATAAIRVSRELTGLAPVGAVAPLPPFEHVLSHRRIRFEGFVAAAAAGAVRRTQHDAHVWVAVEEAVERGVSRATMRLLEAVAAIQSGTLPPPIAEEHSR